MSGLCTGGSTVAEKPGGEVSSYLFCHPRDYARLCRLFASEPAGSFSSYTLWRRDEMTLTKSGRKVTMKSAYEWDWLVKSAERNKR